MIPGLTMADLASDSMYDDEMISNIIKHQYMMMREFIRFSHKYVLMITMNNIWLHFVSKIQFGCHANTSIHQSKDMILYIINIY